MDCGGIEADADCDEDMVGILWKVMGLLKEDKFTCFGQAERVLGLKEELGILVVNNRNDDEIEEEEDDMIGSHFSGRSREFQRNKHAVVKQLRAKHTVSPEEKQNYINKKAEILFN